MKEPYVERVANYDGSESCVRSRKVVVEALTGVRAGWALSREIRHSRTPTLLADGEGNTSVRVSASATMILRGRRPHARTESSCARTGRSSRPSRMVPRGASGRPEATRRW